jgi:hypothetical protein
LKHRAPSSTHKKAVVLLSDATSVKGYVNPATLPSAAMLDLLTPDGEHREIPTKDVKAVYFVADLNEDHEPERKSFLSRPKLEGLWLKITFRDRDSLEGIAANELVELLDRGIQVTPPDLHGNCLRIFVPRSAVAEVKVLGVVGTAKKLPRAAKAPLPDQPRLFSE